jgi:hypothetical protein
MALDDLYAELSRLNRIEKLRAMQFLANELAAEEEPALEAGAEYTIYTPVGNEAAAQVLWEVLQEKTKKSS